MSKEIVIREFFIMEQVIDGDLTLVLAPDIYTIKDYISTIEHPHDAEWIIRAYVDGFVKQTLTIPSPSKGKRMINTALAKLQDLPRISKLEQGDIVVDINGRIYQYDADSPEFGYFTIPIIDEDGMPCEDNLLTIDDTDAIKRLRELKLNHIVKTIIQIPE